MGHLACFAAGNFLLGGRFLARPEIIKLGLDIVDGCHHTYAMTATQIGPEYYHWVPEGSAGTVNAKSNSNLKNGVDPKPAAIPPANDGQKQQLADWGFWITNAKWMLRPEVVESYFYAYRITGNQMYQQWAWDAFTAMNKAAKTKFGYGEIENVSNKPGEDNIGNSAESFFGAETLKYLYLIFAEDNVISLDEWVFSTGMDMIPPPSAHVEGIIADMVVCRGSSFPDIRIVVVGIYAIVGSCLNASALHWYAMHSHLYPSTWPY